MNKTLTFALITGILLLASVGSASAYNTPQSRYSQWYNVLNSYPGGSFFSPQPVASTPIYGYQDNAYGGYAYGNGNNVGRYDGYRYGQYGYGGQTYDPYYNGYYGNRYYNGGSNNGYGNGYYNNPCQYSISYAGCGNRMVYPQPYPNTGSYSYYHNDPYQNTGYNSGYPNYLSYGWEY